MCDTLFAALANRFCKSDVFNTYELAAQYNFILLEGLTKQMEPRNVGANLRVQFSTIDEVYVNAFRVETIKKCPLKKRLRSELVVCLGIGKSARVDNNLRASISGKN